MVKKTNLFGKIRRFRRAKKQTAEQQKCSMNIKRDGVKHKIKKKKKRWREKCKLSWLGVLLPGWLYETASSSPRQTSLRLRRDTSSAKNERRFSYFKNVNQCRERRGFKKNAAESHDRRSCPLIFIFIYFGW